MNDGSIRRYTKGRLLGKGGFAKVHAFTPLRRQMNADKEVIESRGSLVAGKIVAKILLQKAHQRETGRQSRWWRRSSQHELLE